MSMQTQLSSSRIALRQAVLALAIVAAFLNLPSFAEASSCKGCKELKKLKDDFVKAEKSGPRAQFAVVEKIGEKIGTIPRSAEGALDKAQIKVIVEIFQLANDEGFRLEMLERNSVVFRDNRDAFAEHLGTLYGNDPKQILRDIDSVILVSKYGQTPPKDEIEKLGPPPVGAPPRTQKTK